MIAIKCTAHEELRRDGTALMYSSSCQVNDAAIEELDVITALFISILALCDYAEKNVRFVKGIVGLMLSCKINIGEWARTYVRLEADSK